MSDASPDVILNVDDNDAARYVKTRVLRLAGFKVVEASNGADAVALLRSRSPELILLDVRLPDMDGRELAAAIKADPSLSRIVVLQTSASHVESKHRIAALDAGADGYLVEPIEAEELVANVRALLRMRRAERERQAALEALQQPIGARTSSSPCSRTSCAIRSPRSATRWKSCACPPTARCESARAS
ncbi:MAG: response regulator [Usitatibacter sp.]